MRPFRALAALALIAVLPGCGSLGGPDIPVQVYSPVAKVQPDAAWPVVPWSLTSVAASTVPGARLTARNSARSSAFSVGSVNWTS